MPESPPLTYQSIQRRAPEPLEEAVEKAIVDIVAFNLSAYNICDVSVTRADVGTDLDLPAVVVRANRLRESIPTGDVYEVQINVSALTLMDRLNDNDPDPAETTDILWSSLVAVLEDPHLLTILQASRSTVTWHGLIRQGSMDYSRQDRHSIRTYPLIVHVSRLL